LDSSKFNLWRACFSFCQIDSVLSEPEKNWLNTKTQTLKFTNEQKTILAQDLKSPPDILKLISQITKPSDRSFLVDQMRVLAHIDGQVSDVEKAKIDEIKNIIMANIHVADLKNQIKDQTTQKVDRRSYLESLADFCTNDD
jgi:uncharacterized membrane protein YebE (DUF533 family)